MDAWAAACTSSEQAVLAVPVGKAYRIWPVQLFGPCKKKLKLLVRACPGFACTGALLSRFVHARVAVVVLSARFLARSSRRRARTSGRGGTR